MVLLQEAGYRNYKYAAVPYDESVISSGSNDDNSEPSMSLWPQKTIASPVAKDGSRMNSPRHNKKDGERWMNPGTVSSPKLHPPEQRWTITSISPRHPKGESPRRRGLFGFTRSKSKSPTKRLVHEEDFFFSQSYLHNLENGLSPSPTTEYEFDEEIRDPRELVRTRTRDRFKVTLPAAAIKQTCMRLMKGNPKGEDEFDKIEFVGSEKLQIEENQSEHESVMVCEPHEGFHNGDSREEDQVEFLAFESVDTPAEQQLFKEQPRVRIQRIISLVKTLSPRSKDRAEHDCPPTQVVEQTLSPRSKDRAEHDCPPTQVVELNASHQMDDISRAADDSRHAIPQSKERSVRLKSRRRRRKKKTNRASKQLRSLDDLKKGVQESKTDGNDNESVASVALLCQWLQCAEIEGVDPMCRHSDPRGMMISPSSESRGSIPLHTAWKEPEEQDSTCMMEESNEKDMEQKPPQNLNYFREEELIALPNDNSVLEPTEVASPDYTLGSKNESDEDFETILPPRLTLQQIA